MRTLNRHGTLTIPQTIHSFARVCEPRSSDASRLEYFNSNNRSVIDLKVGPPSLKWDLKSTGTVEKARDYQHCFCLYEGARRWKKGVRVACPGLPKTCYCRAQLMKSGTSKSSFTVRYIFKYHFILSTRDHHNRYINIIILLKENIQLLHIF